MNQSANTTKTAALVTLVSVFFFWGFVAASNDILIPVFKEKLNLSQGQSQLVAVAFYVAYTVGSIIYMLLSRLSGGDILNRVGYKNGIAIGLIISAIGTLLFYPAANSVSFNLFLTGLFIVGLGFSLQQTAANPLAIVIGDPRKGAQRLSMAGGINNLGTTIGPLIVSFAIFGAVSNESTGIADINAVKTPYLILGVAFVLVALIFKYSSLPNKINLEDDAHQPLNADGTTAVHRSSALKYPQLVLGMIGIFVYVGVEVATAANLPEFMKQYIKLEDGSPIPTSSIAPYVSLYWASLMMGRWTAAVGAFNVSESTRKILNFVMPYLAFGVFLLVNIIAGHSIQPFLPYAGIILIMIIGDIMSKGNPARQLLIFSSMGIAALLVGMLTNGLVSVYAFTSVGLFCSTLWPCIFTLAIAGLGRYTNEGSSFLIMMIMGGGIISYFQGYLAADNLLGIHWSYIVGVACFVYLAYYAIKAKSILKGQGIDYDRLESAGGH
ncbi:MFS transporter [Phnomibacter ginsenosidimutans]|uniref:MFS transporter n=1 Tax=Phnomibacter ginsenosidimutans TaxID=2676868 RepID=A0A6I6GZ79_9BACT|nr:MFS transporter [Phnomibacter ginsenosidimutans]QGW27821.1 MFS transporter [Phnomibacter ginsenosidimutans]